LKRLPFLLAALIAFGIAAAVTTPSAQAGLFGKSAASPSPSPSPSALPTATPEPPDVAIPRLQAKLKANPNDQEAMIELAGQYLGINRPDLSVGITQHLLQMGDKSAQVYYLDGYALNALGRSDAATADLEQAENLDPSNIGVMTQLADLYVRANRFTDAERIANRAAVLDKDNPQAYLIVGSVYAAESRYEDARAAYEKAFALDPKDSAPLFQIAQTYSQQNNFPMALKTIDRALALDPKDVQALVFKADTYARQKDDTKAPLAYDDAVVAAPTDSAKASILIRKASYYASEKKNDQAQAVLTNAIAQYPREPELHDALAAFWLSAKNLPNAQKEWLAALAIDKNDTTALGALAQYSMQQGRYSDAVGYLKQLTAANPDPQSFALLGQADSFTHDYPGMKDACTKSFSLAKSPETLGCIAAADYQLKNYKEAAQIFDILDANARQYMDQNPSLLFVAAKVYTETNQKPKAIDAYKRLLAQIRKGTKEYTEISNDIAALNKPH
jgi:tetratricopeptide (TPR) repeat protein